ncbi:MAG: SGNH/GDSL hydrolase family protein [Anaerolineales bacterium]
MPSASPPNSIPDSGALRFLALGDSYTIGEAVPPEANWPNLLAAQLKAEGIPCTSPEIIARTGWTTGELLAAVDAAAPQGPYDLVTLQIGVNNQYRSLSLEAYRTELARLLKLAVALAAGEPDHVIVLSIPDWSVTPYAQGRDRSAIAAEIEQFNAAKREIAVQAGVRYVNITPISQQAADQPGLLADDGLHPSGEMYARWVDIVLPEALLAVKH